jgi:ABC-type taurine transport system substrate-binding protein
MLRFENLARYIPMFESRKMISEELVARVGEKISSYRDLVGKREAKSHL